ncbi:MAG: glycosyltransferase family 2 protein [Candidatus Binatia bacterium]
MNGGLSLAIPCRVDEPGLGATLRSLYAACQHPSLSGKLVQELTICINGVTPGANCPPLVAVRAFCIDHDIPLQELRISPAGEPFQEETVSFAPRRNETINQPRSGHGVVPGRIPCCSVILTERRGKPPAWNLLWRRAAGEIVLFCDADVRIDQEAVWFLYSRLQQESHLVLVAAREAPVLEEGGTMWSRMGAIPYRFDFGNAGGRLLMLRKGVLPNGMPEDLLLEDAWLTVAVGKDRVAKEWRSVVYFLPPATGRDYFAERVRTEGGKLQIRRAHGNFLKDGPVATYRWPRFFKNIAWREYPLVMVALFVRGLAHLWARLALVNKEFYALYRPFLTTKDWSRT